MAKFTTRKDLEDYCLRYLRASRDETGGYPTTFPQKKWLWVPERKKGFILAEVIEEKGDSVSVLSTDSQVRASRAFIQVHLTLDVCRR